MRYATHSAGRRLLQLLRVLQVVAVAVVRRRPGRHNHINSRWLCRMARLLSLRISSSTKASRGRSATVLPGCLLLLGATMAPAAMVVLVMTLCSRQRSRHVPRNAAACLVVVVLTAVLMLAAGQCHQQANSHKSNNLPRCPTNRRMARMLLC